MNGFVVNEGHVGFPQSSGPLKPEPLEAGLYEFKYAGIVREEAASYGRPKLLFATHLLEDGYDIHPYCSGATGAQRYSYDDIYTHVLNRGPSGVRSPLDRP